MHAPHRLRRTAVAQVISFLVHHGGTSPTCQVHNPASDDEPSLDRWISLKVVLHRFRSTNFKIRMWRFVKDMTVVS